MENNENTMPVNTTGDHIVAQALEAALGSKVEKEDGKVLSSNDYTDAEKEKLAGIPVLDYTSLEEQIVPGEFWFGSNGSKKQLYMRTWIGYANTETYNGSNIAFTIIDENAGIDTILSIKGFNLNNAYTNARFSFYQKGMTMNIDTSQNGRLGCAVFVPNDPVGTTITTYLTLKYTKA